MTARVPLVADDDAVGRAKDAYASFADEGRAPIDLYRALAHAPDLLGAFHDMGAQLRYGTDVERSVIELVILRTAQLTDSEYEWQHHRGMAIAAGVPAAAVDDLTRWRDNQIFDARTRAALEASEQIHERAVTDAGFAALLRHFTLRQAIEVLGAAAHYQSVARILQALAVEVEDNYR